MSTDVALSVLEYLDKERDFVPWFAARTQLQYLDGMLMKTDLYGKFEVESQFFNQCNSVTLVSFITFLSVKVNYISLFITFLIQKKIELLPYGDRKSFQCN